MKRTFGLLEEGNCVDCRKDDTALPVDIGETPGVCVGRTVASDEEDVEGRVDCWIEGE